MGELICQCGYCSPSVRHKSDCAVHNEPAMPVGPCDCGAGNWMPIETAPKDGTRFLAYCAKGGWQAVLWNDGGSSWQGRPYWSSDRDEMTPTHWMPLPEPPQ